MASPDIHHDLEPYTRAYRGDGPHQRRSAAMSYQDASDATTTYGGARRSFSLTPESHTAAVNIVELDDAVMEDARREAVTVSSRESFLNGWDVAAPVTVVVDLIGKGSEFGYVARVDTIGEVAQGGSVQEALRGVGDGMVSQMQELQSMNGSLGPRREPLLRALEGTLVYQAPPQA